MTIKELIDATAEKAGITKKAAREVYDALVEVVQEEVAKTEVEKLTLPGLVTIKRAQVAARKGRNPATGEEIDIPAKVALRVKPVKALKDVVA